MFYFVQYFILYTFSIPFLKEGEHITLMEKVLALTGLTLEPAPPLLCVALEDIYNLSVS